MRGDPLRELERVHARADLREEVALVVRQTRRRMGPQEEVSPNSDLRHEATLGSGPAQRMPDSHGGSSGDSVSGSAFWKNPNTKPRSRHRMSAVLCTRT